MHFEFRIEDDSSHKIKSIYVDNISKFKEPLGEIMEQLLDMYPKLPQALHMKLYTQLRLAHSFGRAQDRLKCVQVRLHAISVLVFIRFPAKKTLIFENIVILIIFICM